MADRDEDDEGLENDEEPTEPEDVEAPEEPGADSEGEGEGGGDKPAPDPEPEPEARASRGKEKALIAERRKRQEAESEKAELARRVAYLEGTVSATQRHAETKTEPDPDEEVDYSDMKGWRDRGIQRALSKAQSAAIAASDKEFFDTFNESAAEAREEHDDFDQVLRKYIELEKAGGQKVVARLRRAADPAEWAYQYAKRWQEKNGSGKEVSDLKKRIAELEAKAAADPPSRTTKSIAGANGTGHRAGKTPRLLSPAEAFAKAHSR